MAELSVGAIDLHADTPMWMRWVGYDVLREHARPPLPRAAYGGHVDVPRLLRGGYAAQFFGLVSIPVRDHGLFAAVDAQIDRVEEAIARSGGTLFGGRTADDVTRAHREGKVAALLGIEGAHALEGDLDKLDHFARRGVRYLGVLHFSANAAGFPAFGRGRDDAQGLTAWGRALVERCDALGVIVDLAHINRLGFFEALEITRNPVYVSHTGVARVHPHWRNLDDQQIRAVGSRGGAVGVIFAPRFLGRDGVEAVADHIAHVVDVAGEDTPALGSDWDGMIVPSRGLRDPTGLPNLLDVLGKRFPARVVEKIARDNALRVLREVPPRVAGTGAWA
jgi:membrane dipeptidase